MVSPLRPHRAALFSGLLALAAGLARADEWAPNLTTTATWHSNATNANLAVDRIGALQLSGDIIASERYGLTRDDSLHPSVHFGGEWWPRFNGLTSGEAGASLEWRHKFGLAPTALLFAAEAGVDGVVAKESGRRGTAMHFRASLRKRFNDRWRVGLSHEYARHHARHGVYDRRGSETVLEIARDVTDVARLTLALLHRDGDVVSHGTPPRPDLVALAPNRLPVDTFARNMVAYSVDARTVGAKLSFIRAITEDSVVILGYEYRETERTPLRYVNHLVSLSAVHQF